MARLEIFSPVDYGLRFGNAAMLLVFVLAALETIATANGSPAEPFTPTTAPPVATTPSNSSVLLPRSRNVDIIFPGRKMPGPKITVRNKKNCEFNFCTEADDYPTDYILRALKESNIYDEYFTEPVQHGAAPFDIASRIKPEDMEMTMCKTKSRSSYPKTAVNVGQKERVIVNVEGYQQAVVFEVCEENEGKCRFSEMFPNDYKTSCKQKYSIRRLVALNDNDKPSFDSFELPSCCVCTITKET